MIERVQPRPGDRLLVRAVTDHGVELVWARVELVEWDTVTGAGGSYSGRYPFRVGFAYEQIRSTGDVITRKNVIWLDGALCDVQHLVEEYDVVS